MVDFRWLEQSIAGAWIRRLLEICGGAVLAWLRARDPKIAGSILYGLAGVAVLEIIFFFATTQSPVPAKAPVDLTILEGEIASLSTYVHARSTASRSSQAPALTPENVERNVRTWLGTFGYGFVPVTLPNTHFAIRVNLPNNGRPILIARSTDEQFERYITIQASVAISPEHQAILQRMPEDQRQRVLRDLSIEVSRVRTDVASTTLEQVTFARRLLIGSLTEGMLIDNLGDMEALQNIIIQTVLRAVGQ